jgi:hypothetical protein
MKTSQVGDHLHIEASTDRGQHAIHHMVPALAALLESHAD